MITGKRGRVLYCIFIIVSTNQSEYGTTRNDIIRFRSPRYYIITKYDPPRTPSQKEKIRHRSKEEKTNKRFWIKRFNLEYTGRLAQLVRAWC